MRRKSQQERKILGENASGLADAKRLHGYKFSSRISSGTVLYSS